MKKDENNRINRMVEMAHKWDPRILLHKEELKDKKKAAKQVIWEPYQSISAV